MTKTTTAATKTVKVIARIEFKNDPRKVVYQVRASNGTDTYNTFFFNGKASSCTCASRKPCYHMTQLEAKELARRGAEETARAYREMAYSEF